MTYDVKLSHFLLVKVKNLFLTLKSFRKLLWLSTYLTAKCFYFNSNVLKFEL